MQNIIQKLNELGYQTIDGTWYDRVADWDSWYKGKVNHFHRFKVFNGQKHINCTRYSLGMAKKVCEDWANLLMNERVKIKIDGEREQRFIDEVFSPAENDFASRMNELMEKGAARGAYAVVPHGENIAVNSAGNIVGDRNASIALDYLTAPNIYPLKWKGHQIIECAFTTNIHAGKEKYIYLQTHTVENGEYVIHNHMYKTASDGGTLQDADPRDVRGYEAIPAVVRTGSNKPLYVVGRYNIANNIDDDIPLGISVFANSIDVLKGTDKIYDSYVNEFDIGKKRIMVMPPAAKTLDGEPVFDADDLVFYVLPEDMGDGAVIQPIDMTLRTQEHTQALQDQLNMLSSKCGFGENHYRFDNGNISTATQIISENSEMFRTIRKHELILTPVIENLCRTVLHMGNQYAGALLREDVGIGVDYDDSIIEDRQAELNDTAQRASIALQLTAAGLMRDDEARAYIMDEDIETARAALPGMEALTAGEGQDEVE